MENFEKKFLFIFQNAADQSFDYVFKYHIDYYVHAR